MSRNDAPNFRGVCLENCNNCDYLDKESMACNKHNFNVDDALKDMPYMYTTCDDWE